MTITITVEELQQHEKACQDVIRNTLRKALEEHPRLFTFNAELKTELKMLGKEIDTIKFPKLIPNV